MTITINNGSHGSAKISVPSAFAKSTCVIFVFV